MSPGSAIMDCVKVSSFLHIDSMEVRLVDLCKLLNFDEQLKNQALRVFREIKAIILTDISTSGSPEEAERMWHAFLIYCSVKLQSLNGGNRIKLFQILKTAKLSAMEFLKEASQLSLKIGPILCSLYSSDWEKKLELKELLASVTQLYHLRRFYKRAYLEFFLASDTLNSSSNSSNGCYISDYHRFGWLIFLELRVHSVSRFKDLVTCTNELVSILAVLILHVPKHHRSTSVEDSPIFAKKSDSGVNLIASLCLVYNTSEDDLRKALESVNKLISDILKKKQQLASKCNVENLNGICTDDLTYFEDLLDDKSLEQSLLILENDYEEAIKAKGELDERLFGDNESSSASNGSTSGMSIIKFDTSASPAKTVPNHFLFNSAPSAKSDDIMNKPMVVSSTPVSCAMTTAKWLRTVISPLPSKHSQELEHFFACCDADVSSLVTRRACIIMEAIFPCNSFGGQCISGALQNANVMDRTWAEERKSEALKLYYRVLETICRSEFKVNNGKNLTPLLMSERFHRCMLACSAELVLATHNTVTMIFPAVLERTGVTAFDLSKVIETFVRHEETLPRELKRHLNSLEERLLESMVWEKGSSLYNTLIIARPNLSAEIDRLGLLAEPMPSLDSIALHQNISSSGLLPVPSNNHEASPDQNGDIRSPKRLCTGYKNVLIEHGSPTLLKERLSSFSTPKSKLHIQSAFASPARPNPSGGGTCADTQITVFSRKIIKLVASRIKALCERLKCPDKFLDNVYWLIQQILIQQTPLFFNRHIDQIILCCFYGIAKVSQLSMTFKEIINSYKKQPQYKPQVFRSVFVNCRNGEYVDIITFYNEVFVPTVKPLLVEVGPHGITRKSNKLNDENQSSNGQIPGSPRLQPFPTLPDMSPKKVSSSHNVYVSPLRPTKKDALLSPSSKSYYACVGESTHAYQSPSKDLTAINNRLNCRKIKLSFDVVSDSVVAGSLGQQNGSATPRKNENIVKSEQTDS